MEGQVTDMEQEVITTNNNLLLHFSGHSNGPMVLKQCCALGHYFKEGRGARALSYI